MDIGFDGVIGGAGGYVKYLHKMLYHLTMKEEDVKDIQSFIESDYGGIQIETNVANYLNDVYMQYVNENVHDDNFLRIIKHDSLRGDIPVNKISFFTNQLSYEDVERKYQNQFSVVRASWPGLEDTAGEIALKGISKGSAILYLMSYLQLDLKDTYGFGDSMNDLDMFNVVHTSVAMGDSKHGIKEYANFITKDVNDDGLDYAFQKLRLYE